MLDLFKDGTNVDMSTDFAETCRERYYLLPASKFRIDQLEESKWGKSVKHKKIHVREFVLQPLRQIKG